jgi:cyclase
MLTRRIIACLDVKDGVVVKGTQFRGHEVVGGILDLAVRYRDEGVDELVFYDITASTEARRVSRRWVEDVARVINVPFCVAGGIRSVDDAREILHAGADKISINTPALEDPGLVSELAEVFGSQCVVVGVDSMRQDFEFRVYSHTGSEAKRKHAGRRTLDWIVEAERRGAGEIVLNCMNQDGMGGGYDLEQLSRAREVLSIPLVASGGARTAEHFERVFKESRVDAALAAGAFHRKELSIPALKAELTLRGILVRTWS